MVFAVKHRTIVSADPHWWGPRREFNSMRMNVSASQRVTSGHPILGTEHMRQEKKTLPSTEEGVTVREINGVPGFSKTGRDDVHLGNTADDQQEA